MKSNAKWKQRFEKIHRQLALDFFRHVIRDNAFALEYNYLPLKPLATASSSRSSGLAENNSQTSI